MCWLSKSLHSVIIDIGWNRNRWKLIAQTVYRQGFGVWGWSAAGVAYGLQNRCGVEKRYPGWVRFPRVPANLLQLNWKKLAQALRFLTKEAVEETLGVYRMQSERNLSCPRTSTEFGKRDGNFMGVSLSVRAKCAGKRDPIQSFFSLQPQEISPFLQIFLHNHKWKPAWDDAIQSGSLTAFGSMSLPVISYKIDPWHPEIKSPGGFTIFGKFS